LQKFCKFKNSFFPKNFQTSTAEHFQNSQKQKVRKILSNAGLLFDWLILKVEQKMRKFLRYNFIDKLSKIAFFNIVLKISLPWFYPNFYSLLLPLSTKIFLSRFTLSIIPSISIGSLSHSLSFTHFLSHFFSVSVSLISLTHFLYIFLYFSLLSLSLSFSLSVSLPCLTKLTHSKKSKFFFIAPKV